MASKQQSTSEITDLIPGTQFELRSVDEKHDKMAMSEQTAKMPVI